MSHRQRFVLFVMLMSVLVACGGDAEPTTTSEVASAPSTTASDAPSTTGSSEKAATSTSEVAAATTGANTTPPGETVEVSLRLDWLWGAEHAPYFVALEKGYYADAGLDVEILEGEGSTLSARLVGTGDNTFGVVSAGTVLASVSQGIPLQTIATLIQQTPSGIIYDQEQLPMDSLEDLEGNALGVVVDSVTYLEWQSVARLNDLDVDSIDEVAVGENVVQAFLGDRVQAATGWTFNQFLEVTLNGGNAGFLKFADAGLDVPGSTIVANTQTIQEQPEVVDRFVDATLKGWQFALDNPEETLEIFYSYEGEVDQEYNNEKLPLVLDLITPADGQPLGFSSPEAWENLKEVYESGDLLEEDIAVEDVVTNEFVGE